MDTLEPLKMERQETLYFTKIEDIEYYISNKYYKTLENTSEVIKILTKNRK